MIEAIRRNAMRQPCARRLLSIGGRRTTAERNENSVVE